MGLLIYCRKQEEAYFTRKKLGPEPTKKTFKYVPFERALMHSGKSIKPLLLEQKLVAGLGNIYVDEVLWAAKVHPETPANKLSKAHETGSRSNGLPFYSWGLLRVVPL